MTARHDGKTWFEKPADWVGVIWLAVRGKGVVSPGEGLEWWMKRTAELEALDGATSLTIHVLDRHFPLC